jgi:DNA-directed RNA polymerase specialized sigma24 family protein
MKTASARRSAARRPGVTPIDVSETRHAIGPGDEPRGVPRCGPSRRGAVSAHPGRPVPGSCREKALAAFYEEHHGRVRRIVASRVNADSHTIEDACAFAWTRLVADEQIVLDRRALCWLTTAASREGWRLTSLVQREAPASGAAARSDHGHAPPADDAGSGDETLARIEHRERVRIFRTLRCRERRELFLHAIGYRYDEIAAMTGSTYTAVNRRLVEGRAQLRERAAVRGAVAVAA